MNTVRTFIINNCNTKSGYNEAVRLYAMYMNGLIKLGDDINKILSKDRPLDDFIDDFSDDFSDLHDFIVSANELQLSNKFMKDSILATNDPDLIVSYMLMNDIDNWPEAEEIILSSGPDNIFYYITTIRQNSRWPEAEEKILTDPYYAAVYAINILKNRWPKAEIKFKDNQTFKEYYRYL